MATEDDQPHGRPVDGLQQQLDRIEATAEEARDQSTRAAQESAATNGRLRKVEEDLYGPDEPRRREHDPGLMVKFQEVRRQVFDVVAARDESAAVSRALKWIIGTSIAVLTMMIAALTLLLRLTEVI